MSNLPKRLRASVNCGAMNGSVFERAIVSVQMSEAAEYIEQLEAKASRVDAMQKQFERIDAALDAFRDLASEAMAQVVDREHAITDLSKRAQAAEAGPAGRG